MIPFDIMRCILEDVGTRQPTQAEAEAIARHLADGHGKLAGLSDARDAARKPARAPGPDHILRIDTVMRMSGLSYATLWRHERRSANGLWVGANPKCRPGSRPGPDTCQALAR